MALTAKQERFAQNVGMKGMNQSDAYREAYDASKMTPESIHVKASELAKHVEVSARIDVLRGRVEAAAVKKAALTLEDCIDEAGQMFDDAKALGQVSAGVAAAKLRAQLAGHLVEKKADAKGSLDDMDIESLLKLKAAVEDKVERGREALAMTDTPATAPAAVPMRRVI